MLFIGREMGLHNSVDVKCAGGFYEPEAKERAACEVYHRYDVVLPFGVRLFSRAETFCDVMEFLV